MEIEFTFFAVGRTAPTILTFVIAAYLLLRRRPDPPTAWLGGYFLLLGIFNLAYLAAYSVQDPRAAYAWIPACAIGFAAVARLQFAYVFPAVDGNVASVKDAGRVSRSATKKTSPRNDPSTRWRRERKVVFAISLCGAVFALVDYVIRSGTDFIPLFQQYAFGSLYSSPYVPAVSALCYFWSIVVALRIARKVGRRDSVAFRASLQLAGVTVLELAVSGLNLISTASVLGKATVATLSNVAVLFILSAYVVVYASAARKRTGFMHRLVGIALVTMLGLLALISLWLRGPAFEQLRRETVAETRLALMNAGADANNPRSDTDGALILPESAVQAGLAKSHVFQDGFRFFAHAGRLYFSIDSPSAPPTGDISGWPVSRGDPGRLASNAIVAFDYARFRERIHASAFPIALMMVAAALLVLFIFPLLFRASLVSPLRALASDLGHIYRDRKGEARSDSDPEGGEAPDEIAALRLAFQQMTELLEEARAGMPEYATHLARVRQVATGETRRVPVGDGELVYRSMSMELVVEAVERLRSFRHPVLIVGETGTGKEMIARLLHAGPRENDIGPGRDVHESETPFVAVNCAALPEALWESEIFGHRKGAFTDARADRAGRIQEAGHGTVFFDEIGEMPLSIQAKLLRLLQEMEYVPLGADRPVRARCRFVFATHRDLDAMVRSGAFRQDLLYRIQVFQLSLSPLRQRPEDISELADYYLERFVARHPTEITSIDPGTYELLRNYSWPGNIRELENNLLRATAFAKGSALLPEHFIDLQANAPSATRRTAASASSDGADAVTIDFDEQVRQYSRSLIEQALELAEGNKSEAARILGLKRTTLRNRMRDLRLGDS